MAAIGQKQAGAEDNILPAADSDFRGRQILLVEDNELNSEIAVEILKEYESWEINGSAKKEMGAWQYDDTDLDRLSTILTLHDLGFTTAEVETYMRLLLEQPHTEGQRLRMLEEKRSAALNEIHFKERQLQRLDYLRHEIRKTQNQTGGMNT